MVEQTTHFPGFDFLESEPEEPRLEERRVGLALQGGASLGAYTWGVLDAILEDDRLDFDGITGASAGAINAVALAAGFASEGRQGARDALRAVWEGMAREADEHRLGRLATFWAILACLPRIRTSEAFYRLTSHLVADFYLDSNTMEPLRGTLGSTLDFGPLASSECMKIFVNVTDVESGELRVFAGGEIDLDVVCASCAVPLLFGPVEIEGRFYWDGGLLGNPAIFPLIYGSRAQDIVLIETLSPADELPRTAQQVMNRALHIADHAGLVRELRSIRLVTHLLHQTSVPGMHEVRLHRVAPHPDLASIQTGRGFRADVVWFKELFELGRKTGEDWLASKLPATAGGSSLRV